MIESEGLTVVQKGNKNVLSVDQTDGVSEISGNSQTEIIQNGSNIITHRRTTSKDSSKGSGTNSLNVRQSGNGNSIIVKQSGKGNSVSVSQSEGKKSRED